MNQRKLSEIMAVYLAAKALADSGKLGLAVSISFRKLAKEAKKLLDHHIGATVEECKKAGAEIVRTISNEIDEALPAEERQKLLEARINKSDEYNETVEIERKAWLEVVDFVFTKSKIQVTQAAIDSLPERMTVEYEGAELAVPVYKSLLDLIDEEYIEAEIF